MKILGYIISILIEILGFIGIFMGARCFFEESVKDMLTGGLVLILGIATVVGGILFIKNIGG